METLARIGLICLMFGTPAFGHDALRPDLAPWFNQLHSNNGTLCCSDSDGRVVKDIDWKTLDGHYLVFIKDKWIDVPDSAIVTVPNLDGRTMVWLNWINGEPIVSCFLPGPGA